MIQRIIGIDPGVETGFAAYDGKAWDVKTLTFHTLMEWADSVPAECRAQYLCIVEDATTLNIYAAKYGQRGKGIGQIRNIGGNNRESQLVIGELERRGFQVQRFVPRSTWKSKTHKWDDAECREITGYQGQTNEHKRDAMRFAWINRMLLRVKAR